MVLGIDQQVAETLGKRHEVAFGVDDGLLHPGRTLFQQPAQQMDLPEPELPCTSRRVASSSSRSRLAGAPAVVCPISIATVMSRLKVPLAEAGLTT
jgi:hypothetical protein